MTIRLVCEEHRKPMGTRDAGFKTGVILVMCGERCPDYPTPPADAGRTATTQGPA